MLNARVFEKRFQKACREDFLSHFEIHFEAILTLEGPWEVPWDHPGTPLDPDLKKVPKIIKTITFLDLILETFFHQIVCTYFSLQF